MEEWGCENDGNTRWRGVQCSLVLLTPQGGKKNIVHLVDFSKKYKGEEQMKHVTMKTKKGANKQ